MKTVFISNRQSGKSQMATYEFLKNPKDTLFIGTSIGAIQFNPFYHQYKNNFVTQNKIICGQTFERVIFDEYFYFDIKNRRALKELLPSIGVREFYIFSTANRLYNANLYAFVRFMKTNHIFINNKTIDEYVKVLANGDQEKEKLINNEIDDLYYNYLTDPDANVINDDYFFNQSLQCTEKISGMSEEQIKIEFKGEYLKYE